MEKLRTEEEGKPSEAELVVRSRRGNRDAFQGLVAIYGERAFRTAFALLGNREEAEEATQDAFLKAFQNFRWFKGKSSFYTWLYRILSRTCYERVRSKGRRMMRRALSLEGSQEPSLEGAALGDTLESRTPGPREEAIRGEERRRIYEALEKLPREEYEILSMRAVEGFSYEEMAKALGCALGTVMSRLYRARLHLRQQLKKGSDPF